jgi:hypothetical protein
MPWLMIRWISSSQIPFQVLTLLGFAQTHFVRRLDTDEHMREAGVGAHFQHLVTRSRPISASV